jgi:hypothetical protein
MGLEGASSEHSIGWSRGDSTQPIASYAGLNAPRIVKRFAKSTMRRNSAVIVAATIALVIALSPGERAGSADAEPTMKRYSEYWRMASRFEHEGKVVITSTFSF